MTNGRDKAGARGRGEAVGAPRREPRRTGPEPRAPERKGSSGNPPESRRGNRLPPDARYPQARHPDADSRGDSYGPPRRTDKPPRRKRRRRRGSLLLLYLFLIFVAAAAGTVLSFTVFFRIESFEIKGQSRYSDAEILDALTIRQGDNLLRINKEKAASAVLDKLPYAGAVNIRRGFPSSLIVEIKEAAPKYAVSLDGVLYLTDGHFRVLEAAQDSGGELLLLKGLKTQPPRPGRTLQITDKLQSDRLKALLAELQAQSLEGITEIDVGDKTAIKMLYDRRIILLIGTTSGLQRKITAAKRIITGEIAEDKTGTLDLSRVDDKQFTAPFREHSLTN